MANEENNKIYLVRGNDAPLAVCLRKREGDGDPVPYDLSAAERVRLALVGHGAHIFATDVTVTGEDSNIVSGVIPGRALLKGDYDLEVTFKSGGRDKRFAVEDMFTAVDFLAEDADGEAEGEGDGISITVTVQPEIIEIAGPTGPQGHDGKSAYEVWLEDGHTGTEDDFFKWLAAEGLPWNDVDISSLTVRNGYITSSGMWNSGNTYCHTLLPVSAGKAVRVTAAESNLSRYAWLTSGQAPRGGIAADLVPGTERTDVAAGSSVTLDVPVGAKYLYIYLGTPADKANTPESLAVSDTLSSLRSGIDDASENIGVIATEIRYSGVYGHFDGAGSVTVYGGNIFVVAGMSYRLTMLHPDITVTNPTGNVWRLVVSARDDSGAVVSNLVQVSDVSRLSDHYDLTIPSGATRLYIYGRCSEGQTCDYVLERLDTVTYNDGDILTLNPDSEFQPKWQSAAKPYYTSQNTNRPNCVRFLHLSDVHGNWANVRRFLKFYNHWVDKGYDITAINTGDTATDYLTDGVTGYTSINGVDKILGVVGNHDTRGTSGWQQYKGLEVYNALFAPLISGWGVVQPEGAAENGYCYYYKDYATNKLRLVVVDIMGYDDTEDAWLASVLASAKTAGYHVLIATHFAGGRSSAEASQPPYKKIDCQWSTMAGLASDSTQLNGYNSESYKMADTVHAFMEDGGIFCGYMCGHSHLEFVARLDKYPDQMIYTVGSSKSGKVHDYTHTTGTRMQDEFEIVAVDTDSKFVKLYKVGANYDRRGRHKDSVCVSYDTHEVVGFPVTTEALAKEMDDKQDALVSGQNIKTLNGFSILGGGNLQLPGPVQSDWNEDDDGDYAYIKNKPTIPTNVVKYTEQDLTEAQQAQARENIGAAATSGYYPDMRVGEADYLPGTETDEVEGISTVARTTGLARIKEVKGRSLVWNQLAPDRTFNVSNSTVEWVDGYEKITLNDGTSQARGTNIYAQKGFNGGDKVIVVCLFKKYSVANAPYANLRVTNTYDSALAAAAHTSSTHYQSGQITGAYMTFKTTVTPSDNVGFYFDVNGTTAFEHTTADEIEVYFKIYNLTKMFGAGLEPASIDAFLALYPLCGYAYNPGEIISNNTEALEITGLNQWDEEWEHGSINLNTGANSASANAIRSKNYCPISSVYNYFGYRAGLTNRYSIYVAYYDSEKNFISAESICNRTGATPQNARYFRLWTSQETYSTDYKHDICLNVSSSANGTYRPYEQPSEFALDLTTLTGKLNGEGESVTIFPDGMRSAGTAYDSFVVDEDGWCRRAVINYQKIILTGEEEYLIANSSYIKSDATDAYMNIASIPITLPLITRTNVLCTHLMASTKDIWNTAGYPDTIVLNSTSSAHQLHLNISNSRTGIVQGTDTVATAKTKFVAYIAAQYAAGTPVTIVMWRNPLEYVLDTPIFMGIKTKQGGVIRQLPENGSAPTTAPMRMDITYALSPEALISGSSLENLLKALKSANKISNYTMTYNATSGKWEFTIS